MASEPVIHELLATGARPRKPVFTGLDSLTAQERRAAEMAAEGLSNPQIAQALFVTRRTVEIHLRHAYQKLDIDSREKLSQALCPDAVGGVAVMLILLSQRGQVSLEPEPWDGDSATASTSPLKD